MRLIHATVNPDASEPLRDALRESNASYTILPIEDNQGRQLWVIAVGMDQVEPLLEKIRENRDSKQDFAVVSEAEAILSEAYEEHQEEAEEDSDKGAERISREELISRAEGLSRGTVNFILFTVISGIIATVGLLTDSAAVVVGSMVIAPLIGPAMASSVATVVNDNEMYWQGVRTQALGLFVAVLSSCLFAFILRLTILPEVELLMIGQVAERVHPGPLALVVAIGAGIAGALALTSGMSAALVGVMIAVALIPPAATFGIGLAYGKMVIAVSSCVLVLLNLFSINLAGLATLWSKGYRPESWYESNVAWSATLKRSLSLLVMVLILTGSLTFGTYQEHVNAQLHQTVVQYLQQQDMKTLNVRMDYRFYWWYRSPYRVSIRAVNPDEGLAARLREHVRDERKRDLEVRIVKEFIETAGEK